MTHTVIMRQGGLPDAGLREWLSDAIPDGIADCADEAARRSRACWTPKVTLFRGVKYLDAALPPRVAAFTDTVGEALKWGQVTQSWQVPVASILAVVHHPGTGTTEYVVATRGLA